MSEVEDTFPPPPPPEALLSPETNEFLALEHQMKAEEEDRTQELPPPVATAPACNGRFTFRESGTTRLKDDFSFAKDSSLKSEEHGYRHNEHHDSSSSSSGFLSSSRDDMRRDGGGCSDGGSSSNFVDSRSETDSIRSDNSSSGGSAAGGRVSFRRVELGGGHMDHVDNMSTTSTGSSLDGSMKKEFQSELEHILEERKKSCSAESTEASLQLMERRQMRQFSRADEYLYAMKEDLAEWLNMLYPGIDIDAESFMDRLETGEHLIKVRQLIRTCFTAR